MFGEFNVSAVFLMFGEFSVSAVSSLCFVSLVCLAAFLVFGEFCVSTEFLMFT